MKPKPGRQLAERAFRRARRRAWWSASVRRRLAVSPAALCLWVCTTPASAAAQEMLPVPYEVERACRFECCTYRQWSVREPTALHLGRDSSSAVVARVRAGDHVDGLTGMVVTTKPGRAVVLAPTTFGVGDEEEIDVRAGQVLYLLHYQGEGSFKVWLEGRLLDTDIPFLPDSADPRADLPGADATLRTESYPETVWWVKVRTRDAVVGWSAQPDHFGDKDACG